MSNNTPDTIRDQAAAKYTAIRGNRDLSQPAALRAIAVTHVATKSALDAMAEKDAADATAHEGALSTKLLGIGSTDPSAAISHRDAQDRVAAIPLSDVRTPGEMLARATMSGDTAMGKAVLGRAFSTGDTDLAQQYIAANPNTEQDVTDLWNIRNGPKLSPLTAAMTYRPQTPPELSGMPDYQIAAIAASAAGNLT
jgi:hypothetical protein